MSDDQPPGALGLAPLTLADQTRFQSIFGRLAQPSSDCTFANVFIWNGALNLYWAELNRHLCIFANGEDLTMLLPPIPTEGATDADLALTLPRCFEIMDAYNGPRQGIERARIEYVSDEMLERIRAVTGPDSTSGMTLAAAVFSGDYIYPVANMIDLPGGALKSKRHDRNRFMREHPDHRVDDLRDEYLPACEALLDIWRNAGDTIHEGQMTDDEAHVATAELRRRDSIASRVALRHFRKLGMKAMVLFVGERLVGFTMGESLSPSQASILIEKTHPDYHGAPQFIFSEFCRRCWADHPEINVGDDWGIPTLRFTKESYRPSRRVSKYVLSRPALTLSQVAPAAPANASAPAMGPAVESLCPMPPPPPEVAVRKAQLADAKVLSELESRCFTGHDAFHHRQVRALIANEHAICRVVELDGQPAGWGVALVRRHRSGVSGRIYNVAVDPAARRRGLGRRIVIELLNAMQALGVKTVYLEVRADNDRAIGLYQSMGFTVARRLPDYYEDGPQRFADGLSMRYGVPQPQYLPLLEPWTAIAR
jgi:ribosomal protein S18 acetylase RimI-like enzyme